MLVILHGAPTEAQLDLGLGVSDWEGATGMGVQVGKNGVTDTFMDALGDALAANELVKVCVP